MKRKAKNIISIILMLALSFALLMPAAAADIAEAETKAEALKQLGLFKGVSDTDFDLDRAPTRTEALVMLIRMLGRESEALSGDWTHPFTDVVPWADKYIGYAYEKGLTKGVSATEFGTGSASSDMYLTFMLRALGYDDAKGDFVWSSPEILAEAVGILPDGVDTDNFLRADVVLVSWAALCANMKGGIALAKTLILGGVITNDSLSAAIELVGEQEPVPVSVSSEQELLAALAGSGTKAISIDSIGTPVVITGSVTIPSGVTLTISRGNDFYVEGTLTNNGTLLVMGADSFTQDFINYSVMAVRNGGKVINNGAMRLCSSIIGDEEDRGPVGGQLRVFDGTFENNGSVYLESERVNTHGGMAVVEGGVFTNRGTIVMDGFFIRIGDGGIFTNNAGAVVINNTTILTEGTGVFTNNGVISGRAVNG